MELSNQTRFAAHLFRGCSLTFISRVLKAGGRPERLVTGQREISGILPSPRRLFWSVYSRDNETTTIRWIDLTQEN